MGSDLIVFYQLFFFLTSTFFFPGLIEFEECDPASAVEGKSTSCNVWQRAFVY